MWNSPFLTNLKNMRSTSKASLRANPYFWIIGEHPRGDVLRTTGAQKDGVGLWFKMANRNKRCITLNFSNEKGQRLFKRLIESTDVLIENFRTGTMERWGLGWEDLKAINPRLVMVRVTAAARWTW